jgi:hypothetical protein
MVQGRVIVQDRRGSVIMQDAGQHDRARSSGVMGEARPSSSAKRLWVGKYVGLCVCVFAWNKGVGNIGCPRAVICV